MPEIVVSIECRLARAVAIASLTGTAICASGYLLWLMAPEAAVLPLALWWAALHLEAGWSTPRPARVARRDVPARAGIRLAGAGVAPARGSGATPRRPGAGGRGRRAGHPTPGGAA